MGLRRRLPVVILALFLLAGCRPGSAPSSSADNAPQGESPGTSMTEGTPSQSRTAPVIVDDLLPVDEYSSEREEEITHVVIHFMSAVVPNPADPYNMESCRGTLLDGGVSAHYIIDREGGIHRLIPEERAAWHAGRGTWGDEDRYTNRMNQFAIGIELLGMGTAEDMRPYLTADAYAALNPAWIGFTDAQYASLAALLDDILTRRPAVGRDRAHILGHQEYNPQKSDPGALFDWGRIGLA